MPIKKLKSKNLSKFKSKTKNKKTKIQASTQASTQSFNQPPIQSKSLPQASNKYQNIIVYLIYF